MDVQQVKPGLWRWTAHHPDWDDREVGSAYLETPYAVILVDPLVPRGDEERFFAALDRDVERLGLPVAITLTNPWHRRSADELAERYGAKIEVGGFLDSVPGGMQPEDVILHSPSHRALFTGDTLVDGALCPEDWLGRGRNYHVACLRRALELDADIVVTSHGDPFSVAQLEALLHSPPSAV
jgi:glyoxylase-like metal-dependent hydrolase (beta-lactamase superfamily II)